MDLSLLELLCIWLSLDLKWFYLSLKVYELLFCYTLFIGLLSEVLWSFVLFLGINLLSSIDVCIFDFNTLSYLVLVVERFR